MPKVFVIETLRRNIDLSKANVFGEIVYVFPINSRRCGVFRHIEFGNLVLQRLLDLDFDPKEDYVCIAGAMISIVISIIAISQVYDEFSVLLFNSREDKYIKKHFDSTDWV